MWQLSWQCKNVNKLYIHELSNGFTALRWYFFMKRSKSFIEWVRLKRIKTASF